MYKILILAYLIGQSPIESQRTTKSVNTINRDEMYKVNAIIITPELKEKILETTSALIQAMGYVDQSLKLNDMWFNRYDENRPFLEYHYHQNCAWTGTYYPEDANHTTILYNPTTNMMQAHYPQVLEGSVFNQERLPITGFTKGALLIHPSWMAHQVLWNGDKPSHSISFDIAYQLPIGDKEYGSYSE